MPQFSMDENGQNKPKMPENQINFQDGIERCESATNDLELFERNRNANSADIALLSFSFAVTFLEEDDKDNLQIYQALENLGFKEKLTTLLRRIKQSGILEYEEKEIENKTAILTAPEAIKRLKDIRDDILRVETYLSGV